LDIDDDNWEFTGKIKYDKYKTRCDVFFEIEYLTYIYVNSWVPLVHYKKYSLKKRWVTDSNFMFLEVPETTIMECD
jgi:hypothetical protein